MTVASPARKSENMPNAPKPRTSLDILVLSGGVGPEREVSLESGRAAHAALVRLGHRATLSDIAPNNLSVLDAAPDFVFIALHGEFGEDGSLQQALDARGLRYNGSGASSSRLAMNKVHAKERFIAHGIPTPASEVVSRADASAASFCGPHLVAAPAMVKPPASGSSVDTTLARTSDALVEQTAFVAKKYGEALVEQYITGRELTVGVLGDQALPVCEIRTKREFYDYQAKYVDDDTEYLFDVDLPADVIERVQSLSVGAHRALGCRAFSRVDWMVEKGTLKPFALEVNTIPGFTSHSLLPKAAARIGLSFDQLCQRMIELSWD